MSLITKKKINEYYNTEEKGGKYMYYQSYEDYMRSVLGYNTGNIYANTYNPRNDYYYDMPMMTTDYVTSETDEFNEFYPEIYKLIYPMVCKVCNEKRSSRNYKRYD